jgi:uncharacterized membrane protein YebE (DUF533 family)
MVVIAEDGSKGNAFGMEGAKRMGRKAATAVPKAAVQPLAYRLYTSFDANQGLKQAQNAISGERGQSPPAAACERNC